MAEMTLCMGNKNYSSWSMRAWLALRQCGASFEEQVFDLAAPGVREAIRGQSPTGRVPVLYDGDLIIWDSLAIIEYAAERFPQAGLWPEDAAARAVARSVSAEMHSGFSSLRRHMPMNVRRSSPGKGWAEGVLEDIERITSIWRSCRSEYGGAGDYLFGPWSAADCMYAPVASRFATYGVELGETERAYSSAVFRHPFVEEWRAAAEAEPMVNPAYDL